MHERERWCVILDTLAAKRVVTVKELERALDASVATIRRDLQQLEQQGKLQRVHGGAEIAGERQTKHLVGQESFEASRQKHSLEKRAIAERAAALCADGDSIIIDGGTTTYFMVDPLKERPLHVLTSSFPIAGAFVSAGLARVLIPGGEVYREQQVILSPYHDGIVANFYAAKMFMGAQAITQAGLMQTDPILIQSERRLIERAEQLIVLADSSKFMRTGGMILCSLDEIDVVITDASAPKVALEMLRKANVDVIVVPNVQAKARPS